MNIGKLINLKVIGDQRGNLISLESNKNIPFAINRVYYIFDNLPNVERGFHAHISLKQVAICMSGSCTFLLDNGLDKETIVLNDRTKGLLIEGLVWREMKDFSKDAVLVVLASDFYDESDYIRDYSEFKKRVNS